MEHKYTKKLGTKIMMYCVVFAIVLGICIGWVGYHTFRVNILERYKVYTGTLLEIASGSFDGDDMEDCIRTLEESGQYEITRQMLDNVKGHSEISYIYAVYFPDKEDSEQANFVMNGTTAAEREGKTESEVLSALGESSEDSFDLAMKTEFRDAQYGTDTEKKDRFRYIVNDTPEYGYQMTGYTVIRNSSGEGVCILAIDLSMNRINEVIQSYIVTVAVAGVVLLCLFLTVLFRVLNRSVIRPVKGMAHSAQDFVEQTLLHPDDPAGLSYQKMEIRTGDEIEILSDSLVNMMAELKNYMENLKRVTAEKERIGAELAVATQIQASMLPCIFPAFPERDEFDIYATMQPAKEVGGDFYDFFMVDEDHLAVVIADVSGKGVPAALFMVIAKTLIKNHVQNGDCGADVFTNVNRQLCENNEAGLFVTAWMGILQISTGEFVYVNAGHNPPLLRRGNGDFEFLRGRAGFVLAGLEDMKYQQAEIKLSQGDMLYLYTDGVTEAMDIHNELYGEKRLLEYLNQVKDMPLEDILHGIKADIDVFVKGAPQFDDITMLMLKLEKFCQ